MSNSNKQYSKPYSNNNLKKLDMGMMVPHAGDIEAAILSALLVDNGAIHEVRPLIKDSETFYHAKHQHIYQAIADLADNMEAIDLLTVVEKLKTNGKLDAVGGNAAIIELSQIVSTTAHIEEHCRIVLQKYVAREAIKLGREIVGNAYDPETDVIELLAKCTNNLSDIQDITLRGAKQMTMSEALDKVGDRVQFLSNRDDDAELTGVTSGLSKVDKFTSGWQPGSYVTIGARPGMGKTAFLVGNMVAAAKAKIPTGFISLEMTTVELVGRAVSNDSHFHLSQLLTKGFEKPEYFQKFSEVKGRMVNYPCHFNDEVTDITDIIAVARKWKRDNNIGILYVDYLQLISDNSYKGNMREQELSRITRKIKLLAKELKIPVIVPAQLSRECEKRGGSKRPILSDLRESGAIEQDSDIVTFLYRPEVYGIDPNDDPDMVDEKCNSELIFAKFRAGGTGTVLLHWQGDKTKFYNHAYVKPDEYQGSNQPQPATPSQAFDVPKDDLAF